MKKKILSLLVAVCLFIPCLFMLSACGDTVVGKYTLSEVGMGEVSWTKEQYEEKKDSDDLDETEQMLLFMAAVMFGSEDDVTIEFKEDGTCFIDGSIMGQETTEEGTYTVDGDRITILEAIAKAGDVTKAARLDRIAVIRMVDGKQQIFYNDLRTADIFMSPTYYLQQNDIVYVEPKYRDKSAGDKAWQISSTVISVVSLVSSIIWALSGTGVIGG
jgi:hypothetical protein